MLDTFKLAMSINTKRRWIPACAGMTVVVAVAGENLFSAPTEHRHRRNKLRLTVIRPRQHEQRMAISLDEALPL